MKTALPERFRVTTENYARCGARLEMVTTAKDGPNGLFILPFGGEILRVVATGGDITAGPGYEWEHVSVSLRRRTPHWAEMCFVKDSFWGPEEVVVQFHPAEAQYVNNHPYCLHLWKHPTVAFPIPPPHLVGIPGLDPRDMRLLGLTL